MPLSTLGTEPPLSLHRHRLLLAAVAIFTCFAIGVLAYPHFAHAHHAHHPRHHVRIDR